MPNETKNYGTVITTAGAALIAKCILNGGKVNIKTAAAGDGGGEYYEPTVAQTALRGKKWEGDVASAAVSTTNANMIDVKITIDDSVGGFTIREMGLFDDDGTLIAICNTPDTEKVSTDGGVSGKLTMIMHIVVADASVVSFTITPALDTVSRAEMESALAEHNTNGTSHSDIRALALNAVQQGDVYTKPEVNALVGGAVNEHNNSDTAHASIRVDLTGLDSRLKTLELKYGTNVTGSSFEVTFVMSLSGATARRWRSANTRKTSGPRGRTSRLAMTLTLQTMWSRKLWRSTILPQLCWQSSRQSRPSLTPRSVRPRSTITSTGVMCSWSSTRSTCTKRAAATMVRNTVNNGTPPELPKAPALISVTPSSTPALLLATGRWTA